MFSVLLVAVLADERRMPAPLLRFFLRLLLENDLRGYCAVCPRKMKVRDTRERYAMHLKHLVSLGLLERGPAIKAGSSKWMTPTYRLAPQYLLTGKELAAAEREMRATRDRLRLLPASGE